MTKAWAENKDAILKYYQSQKLPLNQAMARMESHGFYASQRAYRQQFRNWGISKYNRKQTAVPAYGPVTKERRRMGSMSSSSVMGPAIYVTAAAKTSQGTPRPAHAHIARPDSIHGMPAMASPYPVPASPYPTPIPTPNSSVNDDGSMSHTREQHSYHGAHHAASREDKMQVPNIVSESGVLQVTIGRESPSSFLLPTAENTTTLKAASWQHSHDAHKHHGDSSDYRSSCSYTSAFDPFGSRDQNTAHQRPPSYAWDDIRGQHNHMELDPHNDHKRPPGESSGSAHEERANQALHPEQGTYHYPPVKTLVHSPLAFGDYSSEYQHSVKSYYGASQHYHEQDGKPRSWGAPEAAPVSSTTAFETRRYHLLPSPPHSQGHPSSPKGANALDERLSTPRILPSSPASIPEIIAQPSLQRGPPEVQAQEHGSGYHSDSLSVTMDFARPYDAAYATSGSPSEPHSSPHEPVASPAAMSAHTSMYPSYHLI